MGGTNLANGSRGPNIINIPFHLYDISLCIIADHTTGNDADRCQDIFATQNEKVTTLEDNIFSEEVDALFKNGTWKIMDLPKDRKAIESKWIFKIKYRSSDEIDRYKARLVAQGFGQKEGIDYEETFSPVVKMVTVRCLLNIVVSKSWHVFQLDVNNAFLYGDFEETVYMRPPEGQSKSDYSLYTKSDKSVFLALLVYVDDIMITGNNIYEIEKFKVFLKTKFMIKDLGKFKYFLGMEVIDTDKGIFLNQREYVPDLLFEYGMLACKPAKTSLMSKLVISNKATDNDLILDNITDYQKLMGKLIYLTNTRPDISYVVHCLSQFMRSPLKFHLKTTFKILRYLKSCPGLRILIVKNFGKNLFAYFDADWANKKHNTLSKSSIEAEYRALASVTSEVIWILKILKDLGVDNLLPVNLHCDIDSANQIADILTKGLDTVQYKKLVEDLGMFDVYQVETKKGC
ncbi:ribonuclease H-like domain-containing protein [Tanacetum coccineum]